MASLLCDVSMIGDTLGTEDGAKISSVKIALVRTKSSRISSVVYIVIEFSVLVGFTEMTGLCLFASKASNMVALTVRSKNNSFFKLDVDRDRDREEALDRLDRFERRVKELFLE